MNFYNSFIKSWNIKFPDAGEPKNVECLKADVYSNIDDQKKALESFYTCLNNDISQIKNQLNQTIYYSEYIKSSIEKLSSIAHIFDGNDNLFIAHSTADDDTKSNSFLIDMCPIFPENIKTDVPIITNVQSSNGNSDLSQQVNSTEMDSSSCMPTNFSLVDLSDTDNEPIHRCKDCSRSFTSLAGLELHEKLHTGERPFECDVCGRAFKLKAQLQTHERVHSGERPFGCSICGKLFRQQCHVVQHLRCHTGEKPHVCKQCGKRFRQKHSLISHENRKCQSTRRPRSSKIPAGSTVWIGLSDTNDSKSFIKEVLPSSTLNNTKTSAHDDSSSLGTNFNDERF